MTLLNTTFTGDVLLPQNASLLDFWRWAFSDLCDDDLKGIFAEWMVRVLLGLPSLGGRRISWANSDVLLASGTRIEVKASALWQSWKLWNEDGTPKATTPLTLDPRRIRFVGLQARTALEPASGDSFAAFKSDIYVFCMNTQADPRSWDAWSLSDWEFYVMTKTELVTLGVVGSVSLDALRKFRAGMSVKEFQAYMRRFLGTDEHCRPLG
jgi:hypothetical protein